MSLRVMHIVAPAFGYTFSGPTRRILRLLREWNVPGIDVFVWGSTYLEHSSPNRNLWSTPVRHTRSVRLLWSLRLLWVLICQRRNYDLLHVHTLWWGGLLAPLLARLLGKKAVYHMSLLGSDSPSGLLAQPLGRLKLSLFKQYHGLIGVSPALIHDCEQYGCEAELLVLSNPMSLHHIPIKMNSDRPVVRQQLGIPNNVHVLLYTGSIIQRKGVDLLIDLFIQLAAQRDDVWLVLVGAYSRTENPRLDENFVNEQRSKLERTGANGRVVWAGLVRDETELINSYLACDLFVFPSRAEGMPNVVIEAMGCGLPVVCSHLPGITDTVVVHEETGLLVPLDSLDGFISATTKLLNDQDLRTQMGEEGKKRAMALFGFERYCQKLAQFYHRINADVPS